MLTVAVKGIVTLENVAAVRTTRRKQLLVKKIGDNSALVPTLVLDLFSYFKNNPFQT